MFNFVIVTTKKLNHQKMQLHKGKKNLSEISTYSENLSEIVIIFKNLLKELNLTYINSLLLKSKSKGIKSSTVFQTLFVLRFLDFKNIQQLMLSGYSKELTHKKDVLYDFMKNPRIDWRRIVWLFVNQILKVIDKKSISKSNASRYLIIDDSLLSKTGKKIELIGKVYDHIRHSYVLGFKMLTLGLWEGKSFIPLDFSLHSEPGKSKKRGLKKKELNKQFTKNREEQTAGYKREKEVFKDKISMALAMIKTAVRKKINAKYILADSWFISEKFINEIQKINTNLIVIGLMKTNRIISINDKKYKANLIPEIHRKKIKYSRKLKCHYISQSIDYKGIEIRAFWIKMKGQNTWKMLITTEKKVGFMTTMKHYQVRWSIEVFFKDSKQSLSLNANQSTDLDAQIAHISMVFMNYMILALKKRFENYETFGILFRNTKEQLLENTLVEKIWIILIELYAKLLVELGVDWQVFIEKLIENQEELNYLVKNSLSVIFSLNKDVA